MVRAFHRWVKKLSVLREISFEVASVSVTFLFIVLAAMDGRAGR